MGEFRLPFEKSPDAKLTDDQPAGTYRYEGPFGPMESYREKRTSTGNPTTMTLWGPEVGEATIAWGPGMLEASDAEVKTRLREGIPLRMPAQELTVSQPRYGLRRADRALVVEGGSRSPRLVRLRRVGAVSLEAPDGAALVRQPLFLERNQVADRADAIDVGTFLLVVWSTLSGRLERFALYSS